jgi:hypothetical protein
MPNPGTRSPKDPKSVGALTRKTSLLRDRPDNAAVSGTGKTPLTPSLTAHTLAGMTCGNGARAPGVREPALGLRQRRTRNDLLFTMSDNTQRPAQGWDVANLYSLPDEPARTSMRTALDTNLVEPDGIEPTTSCLQSRRSPS